MHPTEELKKQIRAIDLAVMAGRKRQSAKTGFVHYHPSDESRETIPVFENFCFAIALFRQKTIESVLEGKEMISRLLAFQGEDGNFPVFLHEYPKCWDFHLGKKIAFILAQVLKNFSTVLDSAFKEKLETALKKIAPLPNVLNQNWFEKIVFEQKTANETSFPIPYDRNLRAFLGDHSAQEMGEPKPLAIEYVLAEKEGFSKRLLRDHIHQLHSAILFPFSSSMESCQKVHVQNHFSKILWEGETLHSLLAPKGEMRDGEIIFTLSNIPEMERGDLFEVLIFTDISKETQVLINDQRGTVFFLGDRISVCTPKLTINLTFALEEGTGDFCGSISRANRPGQCACKGDNEYEAYDWQIGLRTLRREGPCKIQCLFEIA